MPNNFFSDDKEETVDKSTNYQYRIKLKFSTKVFGSFKQSLILDFGTKPLLYKVGNCYASTKKLKHFRFFPYYLAIF